MTHNHRAQGVILVAVLLVTVMAAMVTASLLFRMRAETSAAAATTNGDHAYAAAVSGVQVALALLTEEPGDGTIAPINEPTLWLDNPDVFKNRLVLDDGANRWYFTVYAMSELDTDYVRYGLTDESGKININIATQEVLAALPGMTPELVDALLDYRDQDSDTRDSGAEQDYYDQLPTPYKIRNGPFTTLEELLLVKDFNATIVFGEDANMNGLLEPNEDDGDENFPPDDNDGILNPGLSALATTSATSPDIDAEGSPRVNINGSSRRLGGIGLPQETERFIEQYRADGQTFAHPSQLLDMTHRIQQDDRRRGLRAGTVIRSGVGSGELPIVMDKLTVNPAAGRRPLPGLININTAPAAVLVALPGIDGTLARSIVETRITLDPDARANTAWLYTMGLVDADAYRLLAPLLTTRGNQFRVRCIGFGVPAGRYRIIEAAIDLSNSSRRITSQRDLTRLGPPFALDPSSEEAAAN